jgi:hypothetical protein
MQNSTLKNNITLILSKIQSLYNTENLTSTLLSKLEDSENDFFSDFAFKENLDVDEQQLLAIALLPYIEPYFFNEINDQIKSIKINPGLLFYQEANTGALIPLLQTALLIIYGELDWQYSFKVSDVLKNRLFIKGITEVSVPFSSEYKNNKLLGVLSVESHYQASIFSSSRIEYQLSMDFPAQKITTLMNWEDLVLCDETMSQLNDIISWSNYKNIILDEWGLNKIIKPGYRALFFGPPGTGKTLTATLLGKELDMDVYRIDLSLMVSKYIGETEKNLSKFFNIIENKKCITFFDEADSLFGTRTAVSSSNDKYSNQVSSYLLQRIENFNGITILATNLKSNIDKAFFRRFQSMIEFRIPDELQRKKLWEQSFSNYTSLEEDVTIDELAKKYKLTGGSIVNVVQFATLKAIERSRENSKIKKEDLIKSISIELHKEGKTL